MKLNYKFISLLIILFFVSLSFVSAANDDNQTIAISDDDIVDNSDIDADLLSADTGTFTELQQTIWSSKDGDTITLDKDYSYNSDFSRTDLQVPRSSLTIDGQGHTLDGKSASRIFYVTDSATNLVIKNLNLVNGKKDAGGAIFSIGANTQIINCTFSNNEATTSNVGGAILLKNGGSITGSTFTNNVAKSSGGAIRLQGNEYVVTDCTFTGNKATSSLGGAISVLGNKTTISGNTFTNNVAGRDGGALDVEGGVKGNDGIPGYNNVITNNVFTGNTAIYGGALSVNGGQTTISNNKFSKNHATELGGGLRIVGVSGTTGTIKNNTYDGDYADKSGGAIFINGNGVTISENKIKNTKASSESGGAITIHGDKNTITKNDFSNTDAKTSGGAIFFEGSNGKITDNNFTKGHSGTSGGALYVTGASATVSNNIFKSNTANTIAGAVQLKSDNGVLSNNQFDSNTAKGSGGAAYIEGSGITASSNVFTNNKGESDSVGGAIRWNGDKATVTENRFAGNSATQTGYAVYGEGNNAQITKNTFVNSQEGDKTLVWKGENNVIRDNIYGDDKATKLTASNVTMYYGGSSKLVITLNDGQNKPLAKETISVKFNNEDYSLTTDSKGEVSIDLNNLGVGDYKATANFAGDSNHDASSATATVSVKTTVDAKDLTADYNSAAFNATFYDTAGKALAKGTSVSFAIDNDNYTAKVGNNGIATLNVDKTPGNYDIQSINPTTGETKTNKLTINKAKTTTTLTGADNATVGDKTTLVANVDADAGYVVFKVNNNETTVNLTKGKASLELGALSEGKYDVTATYKDPNNNYITSSASASFAITKKSASLNVNVKDILEEESAVFDVSVVPQATGQVTLSINKKTYTENITKGKATFTIANLTMGSYPYTVKYSGDDNFASDSKTGTLNVKSTQLNIDAPNVIKYYGGSERFVVKVTDKQNNPLANINVTVTLNGMPYTRTTKEDGTFSLPLNLNSGNYTVPIVFEGNDDYGPVNITSNVTIKSTVNGSDVTKIEKAPMPYSATFLDSTGKYLTPGEKIQFNINGVFYERVIKEKGIANLNLNIEAGTYVITAINTKTGEKAVNTITILPRIVNNSDVTKLYRNGTQYYVTVLDDSGKPVSSGGNVTFNINGVFYNRMINENGTAKLNLNLQPGDYVVTAEYKKCRVANNIKILPVLSAKNITMKYRDGTKFEAKLVDGQGKPLENDYINFNINGILYKRITDSTGTARLNINLMAGKYIITSSYNGANIANTVTITA